MVLDRGEEEKAAVFLWAATRSYIGALELGGGSWRQRLGASAGRSGRPPSPESGEPVEQLAEAVRGCARLTRR